MRKNTSKVKVTPKEEKMVTNIFIRGVSSEAKAKFEKIAKERKYKPRELFDYLMSVVK